MDSSTLILGFLLIGAGFLLLAADLFLMSGILAVLSLGAIVGGVILTFLGGGIAVGVCHVASPCSSPCR